MKKTDELCILKRAPRKTKPVKINLYGVIWRDACHSFNPDKENTELAWALDVGFGLEDHDDRIIIGRQVFDDGGVRHTLSIPKGCLRKLLGPFEVELPSDFTTEPILR